MALKFWKGQSSACGEKTHCRIQGGGGSLFCLHRVILAYWISENCGVFCLLKRAINPLKFLDPTKLRFSQGRLIYWKKSCSWFCHHDQAVKLSLSSGQKNNSVLPKMYFLVVWGISNFLPPLINIRIGGLSGPKCMDTSTQTLAADHSSLRRQPPGTSNTICRQKNWHRPLPSIHKANCFHCDVMAHLDVRPHPSEKWFLRRIYHFGTWIGLRIFRLKTSCRRGVNKNKNWEKFVWRPFFLGNPKNFPRRRKFFRVMIWYINSKYLD